MLQAFQFVSISLSLCAIFCTPESQAQYVQIDQEFGLNQHTEHQHLAFLAARRDSIPGLLSPFNAPPKAKVLVEEPEPWLTTPHPWRRGITATVFWVGERASERNPTPNDSSAWDPNWQANFGGEDHPAKRNGYLPAGFTPKLNPFYIALPYNDLAPDGVHYPEASEVIPWFWKTYRGEWTSVCKGRWIAVHYRGKVCYAQWEDCGPFNSDDWQYVFRGQQPKPTPNGNAGIEVSPAIRDYLGIRSGFRVSWKFIEDHEVPNGPWTQRH
ncbi:hypothetical protein HW115_02260 [Verrucomicrobiaceae bacterium N1E253]|uniref:Uncharacterized protein n=1 Tax=Oceaniferula marina TaxID=2748318 RepID=A0A851GH18_9BACT|nr:hypothetical protein [Oceaniferula marina]NWK54417.1 hypothetical protein [Oceaniferula marina]